MSGTSMSAAVVSGAAALLLEARPQLTPAQVKATLQLTSSRVEGAGLIEAGAGSLNVLGARGPGAGEQAGRTHELPVRPLLLCSWSISTLTGAPRYPRLEQMLRSTS